MSSYIFTSDSSQCFTSHEPHRTSLLNQCVIALYYPESVLFIPSFTSRYTVKWAGQVVARRSFSGSENVPLVSLEIIHRDIFTMSGNKTGKSSSSPHLRTRSQSMSVKID